MEGDPIRILWNDFGDEVTIAFHDGREITLSSYEAGVVGYTLMKALWEKEELHDLLEEFGGV